MKSYEFRQLPQVLVNKNGRSTNEIKTLQKWNKLDNKANEANSKNLQNYIFNNISPDEFYSITMCKYAKKAWDIIPVMCMSALLVMANILKSCSLAYLHFYKRCQNSRIFSSKS